MISIAASNATFLGFNIQNKRSLNFPGIDSFTSSCCAFSITKSRPSRNNNINSRHLVLSKANFPLKISRGIKIKSFWQWFESKGDAKNNKDDNNDGALFTEETPEFLRFRANGGEGGELQTAVVSYRKQLPWSILQPRFQVDLVAAVHIADKEYFEGLQKELADYDRVLYEMVADKEFHQSNRNPRMRWMPPKRLPGVRGRKFSIIGIIQRLMAYTLSLDFQLDCLDYRRANWYHADLDYQTFKVMQFEREENLFELAVDMAVLTGEELADSVVVREDLDPWRSKLLWASRFLPMPLIGMFLIESICGFSSSAIYQSPEMKALFSLDVSAAVKLFLAKQLTSFSELIDGKRELVKNSVIIGERNRVAMEELRAAMDDGCKKIAILYGGGHMPDMDQRLRTEFGLAPSQISWRTAWLIKNRTTGGEKQLPPFLSKVIKSTGWQLNRYQTLALLIISVILAADLWLWELFFSSLTELAKMVDHDFTAAVQYFAQT